MSVFIKLDPVFRGSSNKKNKIIYLLIYPEISILNVKSMIDAVINNGYLFNIRLDLTKNIKRTVF